MSEPSAIETVTRRLQAALDALDDAVERRLEADLHEGGLADQMHALELDRARLASALDGAVARARELETANRDVARRLDNAIATIRSVIAAPED